jgi:hypothetical protein
LSHTSSPFCSRYLGDGVSQTICQSWSQTLILPISAYQVARITEPLALGRCFLKRVFLYSPGWPGTWDPSISASRELGL